MKIRKFIAIILTMVMLVSISVITVSASYEASIAENETVTVSVSLENSCTLKFVPTEDKTLALTSDYDESILLCYVYDENNEFVAWSYTNIADTRFNLVYDFEAGKTYYFEINTYTEEAVTFDVTLGCAHSYTDGICDNCGNLCDHSYGYSRIKLCDCGYAYGGEDIACDETVAISAETPATVFRFIPEESGNYIFRSDAPDGDPMVYLFSGNDVVNANDDFSDSYDFLIFCELTAGEAYYFYVDNYMESDYEVSLTKAVHTLDDGTEHEVEFYESEYNVTCQEIVYTDGIYCPECDEYIEGHLEEGYGWCEDNDFDDYCDYCGESMYISDFDEIVDLFFEFLDALLADIQEIFDFITGILITVGVW